MLKETHIAVHLVDQSELPEGMDVAMYVRSKPEEMRADVYCSTSSPAVARQYVVDLIQAIRCRQLAL